MTGEDKTDEETFGEEIFGEDKPGGNRSTQAVLEERPTEAQMAEERATLTGQREGAVHKLDELEAAARAAEDEYAALDATRGHYELLQQACESVEKLSEQGAGELFWGENMAGAPARSQLSDALGRIDDFHDELKRLRDKHQAALDAIYGQQETLELVDYDLYQALQQEESRQREWIVERPANEFPSRLLAMPWMRGFEEDKRFQKTLAASAFAALLFGVLIPIIDLPIPERDELVEIPERFAQFIRKEAEPPPPQPLREKRPEEIEPDSDPEETVEPPPEPVPAVEAEPKSTREKVNSVGILAFRENFSNLSESRPAARLGSEARVSDDGAAAVNRTARAMVATQGSNSSGGINIASLSRDISGGEGGVVEGVALTRVESSIDGGGTDDRPRAAGALAGRTDEEIQIVFDRYKAALYRLYNRELRKDPTLRGQMVLRLTIEPDGSVSLCGLQSSDMKAPDLAQRVVDSVSAFQFGEKDVPVVTILYPIDFLPTA